MAYAFQPTDDDAVEMTPSPLERAAARARTGQVTWLTEHGQRAMALLPADIAERALQALEDADDLAAAAAVRDEPRRPLADVLAEMEREDD